MTNAAQYEPPQKMVNVIFGYVLMFNALALLEIDPAEATFGCFRDDVRKWVPLSGDTTEWLKLLWVKWSRKTPSKHAQAEGIAGGIWRQGVKCGHAWRCGE